MTNNLESIQEISPKVKRTPRIWVTLFLALIAAMSFISIFDKKTNPTSQDMWTQFVVSVFFAAWAVNRTFRRRKMLNGIDIPN